MVKVAFVGCGGIQNEHYKHLCAMDDVRLVGHCDVEKARAEAAAEKYGGDVFTDYKALYDKTKPDAVYVSVPPFAHVGMEEEAAGRGIHLFVEKPVATELATAKRIAEAIRKSEIIVSVGYCFRYYDTVSQARQILKGKCPSLIHGAWNGGMPEVWWWRRMDKSGGQVVEQTTHIFDLVRYLCGEVAEVYAVASTGCQNHVESFSIHDSSVVSLRLKCGGIACITSSCVANHSAQVGVEIVTPDMTLSIAWGKLTMKEDSKVTEFTSKVNIYEEESKVFIEAVKTGKRNKIRSSYTDALKTFMVTHAANESIRSGLPVKP
ncbi:MAG: Gfo/Idh/MocA family oxidoreductase [Candidatus Hydrogenedentes bacterium]|nr:Gfo/Idh/MocA family oxidoreductase [Candidatus Hydrogenedentota bacterium]